MSYFLISISAFTGCPIFSFAKYGNSKYESKLNHLIPEHVLLALCSAVSAFRNDDQFRGSGDLGTEV